MSAGSSSRAGTFKSEHPLGLHLLCSRLLSHILNNSLKTPPEKRKEVADRIKAKYADHVPVIVERAQNSDAPDIDKKKFAFYFIFIF